MTKEKKSPVMTKEKKSPVMTKEKKSPAMTRMEQARGWQKKRIFIREEADEKL